MTDSLFEAVAHAIRELTKYGFSTQDLQCWYSSTT